MSLPMKRRYCEVALPVPLRSTFTYAVPATWNGDSLLGRRVVVPFRNRAMVGVVVSESDAAPDLSATKLRVKEIGEAMDFLPALPPKLVELGEWISRYYLAPIGETFRGMLPPEVELRHQREYSLTEKGRAYLAGLGSGEELTEDERRERDLLRQIAAREDEEKEEQRAARRKRRSAVDDAY